MYTKVILFYAIKQYLSYNVIGYVLFTVSFFGITDIFLLYFGGFTFSILALWFLCLDLDPKNATHETNESVYSTLKEGSDKEENEILDAS